MYRIEVVKTESSRPVSSSLSKQFPEVLRFAQNMKKNQTLAKNIGVSNSHSITLTKKSGRSTQNFFKRDQEINIENLREENIKIKGTLNNYMIENMKLTSEMQKMEKDFRKSDKLEKFMEDIRERKKNFNENEIVAKLKKVSKSIIILFTYLE